MRFSARYAQTRLVPSPCLNLIIDPDPPSAAPAKCKTTYSPVRSAYVRGSRFRMRPSGVLTRFMAHTDYRISNKRTTKFPCALNGSYPSPTKVAHSKGALAPLCESGRGVHPCHSRSRFTLWRENEAFFCLANAAEWKPASPRKFVISIRRAEACPP